MRPASTGTQRLLLGGHAPELASRCFARHGFSFLAGGFSCFLSVFLFSGGQSKRRVRLRADT
eukprot:m.395238 g.395238  ORF g.395238 m.395238 type:complete len:62 (+) comp56389_c0_seq1:903-1088(+)